ncbi:MAG: Nif3-like dinuclear metal center hexameric protein, partial [Thermodesulfobacteriota bacterium]
GFGRIGRLSPPLDKKSFLKLLAVRLDLPALAIAGPVPDRIEQVAVCGGSGSDLAEKAFEAGAQVYITAELKHSVARWAEDNNFCIIDGGHYATENVIVQPLVREIKKYFSAEKADIPVQASKEQKNPCLYFINNNLYKFNQDKE